MLTRCSAVALLILACASTIAVPAQPNGNSATLEAILSKLDAMIRRIESLEQRISQLEASVARRNELKHLGTVGPYLIDKHGYLYDEHGKEIGIWGVNEEKVSEQSLLR